MTVIDPSGQLVDIRSGGSAPARYPNVARLRLIRRPIFSDPCYKPRRDFLFFLSVAGCHSPAQFAGPAAVVNGQPAPRDRVTR